MAPIIIGDIEEAQFVRERLEVAIVKRSGEDPVPCSRSHGRSHSVGPEGSSDELDREGRDNDPILEIYAPAFAVSVSQ